MINILLPFFFIIASGVVFRWLKPGGLDADKIRLSINTTVFNLFLPALCVKVFTTADLGAETFAIPLAAWLTLFVMIAVNYLLFTKVFKREQLDGKSVGALIIAATMGNVTYLGLPFLTGLYGQKAAQYALYYDLLATTPFLWLVGVRFGAHFGTGKKISIRESLIKLAYLPPLWGIALGIIVNVSGMTVPVYILKALEMMAGVVVPLMTFSVGLSLTFSHLKKLNLIAVVVVMKLLVSPFVSLFAGRIFGLSDTALYGTFLEGGMPTMVLSLLIAVEFGLDVPLAALCIVVTTICSFVTLPLLVYLTGFLNTLPF
ncbi:MAG: AEC family transporter [bacterium]